MTMTQSRSGGHGVRPFQFSEYENSFRRPSNPKRSSVDPVAGQPSSKTAAASEASKRAHLNRRAQWNGVWPAPNAGPAARSATPPRARARTPPRCSGSSGTSTPPRASSSAAETVMGNALPSGTPPRAATPPRVSTPPRSMRDAAHIRRNSDPVQDISPRGVRAFAVAAATAGGSAPDSEEPTSLVEAGAGTSISRQEAHAAAGGSQQDLAFDEELPGLGTPRRLSGGGSSSSTARASSGKYLGDDPTEELCSRWEAWAQCISQAAEEGATLPPPPVPQPHTPGVTVPLLRVLEASAFAAAALARGSMDAKGLRTLTDSLESDLAQSRAEAKRLQANPSNQSLRRQIEDLQREAESGEAEVRRLQERSEELEALLAAEALERKQAEKRLKAERDAPCSHCQETQMRLTDVADEVESLRAALKDAEARRRKEVEDALWIADNAEAKHEQIISVLRQVLASGGSVEGMHAAAAVLPPASLPAAAASRPAQSTPSESSRSVGVGASTRPPESELFERIDFDKNGMITRQEFRRAWKDGLVGSEVEVPREAQEGSVISRSSTQPVTPRDRERGASPRASPSTSRNGAAVSPRNGHISPRSGSTRAVMAGTSAARGAGGTGSYSSKRVQEQLSTDQDAASRLEREVVELCKALGGDDRTSKPAGGDSAPSTPRRGGGASASLRGGDSGTPHSTPGGYTPRSGSRARGGGTGLSYSGVRR